MAIFFVGAYALIAYDGIEAYISTKRTTLKKKRVALFDMFALEMQRVDRLQHFV